MNVLLLICVVVLAILVIMLIYVLYYMLGGMYRVLKKCNITGIKYKDGSIRFYEDSMECLMFAISAVQTGRFSNLVSDDK